MKVIADSSTTRTEWALVDDGQIVEHAFTTGLNPYFQSRRDLSHAIRLELPEAFFRRRWDHVYFYGAGCANKEKRKTMESSLVAQFRTPVTVESDLLGAARGLLVHDAGLACIIGTGSNSCMYNGTEITRNVPPLGYVLGDEGSGAYIGKTFVADVLRGLAPEHLVKAFFEAMSVTHNMLMDAVYSDPMPSRSLARYSGFLADHMADPYVHSLLFDAFMRFFERNISAYDYSGGLSVVGRTAVIFREVLEQAATAFGVTINRLQPNSLPGLIAYHS